MRTCCTRAASALLLLAAQEAPQPAAKLLLLATAGLRLHCSSLRERSRRPGTALPSALCLAAQARDVLLHLPQTLSSGAEQLVGASGCGGGRDAQQAC